MRSLFFDTETNGLPPRNNTDWKKEPLITQFAGKIIDDGRVLAQFSAFVQPRDESGKVIPMPQDRFFRERGYTDDFFKTVAMPPHSFLRGIAGLFAMDPERIVAHNATFDYGVLDAFVRRHTDGERTCRNIPVMCSMRPLTDIMKLPSRGFGKYKWPTLMEAYCKFVDPKGFEGAHNAMNDVDALIELVMEVESVGVELEEIAEY